MLPQREALVCASFELQLIKGGGNNFFCLPNSTLTLFSLKLQSGREGLGLGLCNTKYVVYNNLAVSNGLCAVMARASILSYILFVHFPLDSWGTGNISFREGTIGSIQPSRLRLHKQVRPVWPGDLPGSQVITHTHTQNHLIHSN